MKCPERYLILAFIPCFLVLISGCEDTPEELEEIDYIWVDLGKENIEHHLSQTEEFDGITEYDLKSGTDCRKQPFPYDGPGFNHIYFDIDDSFICGGNNEVWIAIEYFDNGYKIVCQYDSNGSGDRDGAFKDASILELENTRTWKAHVWHISDGRFVNRSNGHDFRISTHGIGNMWINRVWVLPFEPPNPFEPENPSLRRADVPAKPKDLKVVSGSISEANQTAENNGLTLVAVGDIMLDRGVGSKIKEFGAGYPFERVSVLLKNADLTFGNLETPISNLGSETKGKEVNFRAAPNVVDGLRDAGIDIVSLANNHAMDYGPDALAETMDILAHNGIIYIGAGANSASAHRQANLTINGIKVSFLAYTNKFHMVVEAQQNSPGTAIANSEQIKTDIQKSREWADVVVTSFHWGWEYSDHPDKETRELAHLMVESGADLVIGHHPHVIQGVELYKNGLICYSLGNFIFDQRGKRTTRGLALRCSIGKTGVEKTNLIPIIINAVEFRPGLAIGEAANSILLELKRLSKQLGTDLELKENTAIVLKKEAMSIGS